jgi:hypothetical protein
MALLVHHFSVVRLRMSASRKPQRIRRVQRVVPRERIGLTRLGHVRINAQELVGARVVVAPN